MHFKRAWVNLLTGRFSSMVAGWMFKINLARIVHRKIALKMRTIKSA